MYGEKEVEAVTKIQAIVRGNAARNKYQIKQIPNYKLQDYNVMIAGNDPVVKGLPRHPLGENIALIGTSGMRSVELACKLSEGAPKLIILDNSKQVLNFWRAARDIMSHSSNAVTFLTNLRVYVTSSQCNRMDLTTEEFAYLANLFKQYGAKIKQIITKVSVIGQSWADDDVMIKLKNVLVYNGIQIIYAYPSNIAACVHEEDPTDSEKVLKNIATLNPAIAIHTDLCNNRPENFFLITDHAPAAVKQKLKLDEGNRASPSIGLQELFGIIFSSISWEEDKTEDYQFTLFKKGFLDASARQLDKLIKKYKLTDKNQLSLEKGLRNAVVNNNIGDVKTFIFGIN